MLGRHRRNDPVRLGSRHRTQHTLGDVGVRCANDIRYDSRIAYRKDLSGRFGVDPTYQGR